jgi:hypothetical protein
MRGRLFLHRWDPPRSGSRLGEWGWCRSGWCSPPPRLLSQVFRIAALLFLSRNTAKTLYIGSTLQNLPLPHCAKVYSPRTFLPSIVSLLNACYAFNLIFTFIFPISFNFVLFFVLLLILFLHPDGIGGYFLSETASHEEGALTITKMLYVLLYRLVNEHVYLLGEVREVGYKKRRK